MGLCPTPRDMGRLFPGRRPGPRDFLKKSSKTFISPGFLWESGANYLYWVRCRRRSARALSIRVAQPLAIDAPAAAEPYGCGIPPAGTAHCCGGDRKSFRPQRISLLVCRAHPAAETDHPRRIRTGVHPPPCHSEPRRGEESVSPSGSIPKGKRIG